MESPADERGSDAFRDLLREGAKGARPKSEALEALSLRPVWLATWEPRAEGFRTLINTNGEEALAVFSSERVLKATAEQFGWLEADGTIATHRAIGGDILRHAWTREYAFVVIDIGMAHSLEYERGELKTILREMDSTGPFRTSRPPPPPAPEKTAAQSSFPPPVERISTMYSMGPSEAEKITALIELPTQPYAMPYDSEPPTQPRAAVKQSEAAPKKDQAASTPRKSSRPARKPKSEPPNMKIEEVQADEAELGDGGTYGAASVFPTAGQPSMPITPSMVVTSKDQGDAESDRSLSSNAPRLNSDAPTAPAAQALPSFNPQKLRLPAVPHIGPPPPVSPKAKASAPPKEEELTQPDAKPRTVQPQRIVGPSIGDGIQLVELQEAPNEDWLKTMAEVLRAFFEIEWASYCEVARKGGDPTPAVGLRIADNFRDNVTAIIKELIDASRRHDMEVDVLLIDGHDMLRKARENGFVFYPWKPKPFAQ